MERRLICSESFKILPFNLKNISILGSLLFLLLLFYENKCFILIVFK